MSESAFDDYLTQWREASPQRSVAWLFLRRDERTCFGALAALGHTWQKAVREVRESQVAAVKLGWWREEMQRAAEGQARHPLTQALFADARARSIPLQYWVAPVEAAIGILALPSPADVAAQSDAAAPFANAAAALEVRLWFGEGADAARMSRAVLLAGLASNARALLEEVEHGRSPLPMNLLARHGLTMEALGSDSPARRAALRDYLGELELAASDVARMQGPLTLFRAVDLQRDRQALGRAARADDPLAALHAPAHGLGNVLKTWRAARKWRGMVRNESRP
ncbi:MAG TPA: squalene/phytoene synthase family protein [Rhodanobacteraceae bacterium]|nr:squalene/phytoene synthase family protein [Rhodanobacteraceae bacterium]